MSTNQAEVASTEHRTVAVTDATFEELVLNSDTPVVVDFWAERCPPCRAIAPSLEALAADYAGKLVVAKLDVDQEKLRKVEFGIQGIPTLLFFHKGEVVQRHVGGVPKAQLRAAFEQFLIGVGAMDKPFTPEQQVEFDAIVAVAEAAKETREQVAFAARDQKMQFSLNEWTAIRIEFLTRLLPELSGDEADIAKRGAAGEWDEPVYRTFEALRKRVWDEERFADLVERDDKAREAANTPEMKEVTAAVFAELEAAEAEYDATVEGARKRILSGESSQ